MYAWRRNLNTRKHYVRLFVFRSWGIQESVSKVRLTGILGRTVFACNVLREVMDRPVLWSSVFRNCVAVLVCAHYFGWECLGNKLHPRAGRQCGAKRQF